jgi:hypothetical protein
MRDDARLPDPAPARISSGPDVFDRFTLSGIETGKKICQWR